MVSTLPELPELPELPAPRPRMRARRACSPGLSLVDPGAPARPTPYLDLDVGAAVTRYRRLGAALPGTAVHYAVRTNPHPALLAALVAAGCRFDAASPAEVVAVLEAGAAPADLIYSHPVAGRADIAFAARLGVRLFVVASLQETAEVAGAAPAGSVLCRLDTTGARPGPSLSRRAGCSTDQAVDVLVAAAGAGLDPAGVSFHVGSQQRDPAAWQAPVAASARIFERLRRDGLRPWLLDLGGGFPAHLEGDAPPLSCYGAAIELQLRRHFDGERPRTVVRPGRAVAADAATLVSTVTGVVRRGAIRRVFLDVGVSGGAVETVEEAHRYRLRTTADGGPTGPCVLAGPTCDSTAVLHGEAPVQLPLALAEGDVVRLLGAGAHPASYSTVGPDGSAGPAGPAVRIV